jgi:hypothetical protein
MRREGGPVAEVVDDGRPGRSGSAAYGKSGNPPRVFSPAGEAPARNCRKSLKWAHDREDFIPDVNNSLVFRTFGVCGVTGLR